jgi:energy-coupling factor transporter transmembrane protein EcfT
MFDWAQWLMYALLILFIFLLAFTQWKYKYVAVLIILSFGLMRLFNPIIVNYKCYKAQKQSLFGGGPNVDTETEIETFDGG